MLQKRVCLFFLCFSTKTIKKEAKQKQFSSWMAFFAFFIATFMGENHPQMSASNWRLSEKITFPHQFVMGSASPP